MKKLSGRGIAVDLDEINGIDYSSLTDDELFMVRSENKILRRILTRTRQELIKSNKAIRQQRSQA